MIPNLSVKELQEMLNSLTPEELAEFCKETATQALNRLFSVFNEALTKSYVNYRYDFKIDIVSRELK